MLLVDGAMIKSYRIIGLHEVIYPSAESQIHLQLKSEGLVAGPDAESASGIAAGVPEDGRKTLGPLLTVFESWTITQQQRGIMPQLMLTLKEYEQLGSPFVGSVMTLDMKIVKERKHKWTPAAQEGQPSIR